MRSVECSSLAHVYGWMHQAVVMFVCVVCLCFVNSGLVGFVLVLFDAYCWFDALVCNTDSVWL